MRRLCTALILLLAACAPVESGGSGEADPPVATASEPVVSAMPHGPDLNGDGKADIVTVSPDGGGGWASWMTLDLSLGTSFSQTVWGTTTPLDMRNGALGGPATYVSLLGDFNGDGKTDIATVSPDGGGGWAQWIKVDVSTGAGFNPGYWKSSTPQNVRNGGPGSYRHLVGDFNGDGKSDIATLTPDGGGGWSQWMSMDLSTGSGFTYTVWPATTPLHMRNGGSTLTYVNLVGDFNGDGKSDIATFSQDAGGGWASWAAMELSTGSGFTSTVWATPVAGQMRDGDRAAGRLSRYAFLVGDFDGDGRSDVAVISQDAGGNWAQGVTMNLSNGSGFTTSQWPTVTPQHMRNGGVDHSYRYLVGDFNGDGKSDIVTLSPDGGGGWAQWASVDLSTGSGFAQSVWPTATPQDMRNGGSTLTYEHVVGDFNGDGKSDVATISPNGGGGWSSWYSMDITSPTGNGFNQTVWQTLSAQHMRNGGPAHYNTLAAQGTVIDHIDAPPYRPTGAIAAYWLAAGGPASAAGLPTGPVTAIAGGQAQAFSGGTVYTSAYGTALVAPGPINTAWQGHTTSWGQPSGGYAGELGFPIADAVVLPDGGSYQRFQAGGLHTPIALAPGATTAFALGNAFWLDQGGPAARAVGSGLDQAIGWPVEPVKNYGPSSPYAWDPEIMGCRSLRASRMDRQVFRNALGQENTWCFFQDSAPQNEFMPDRRDCIKSALDKTEWKNPGQSLDDVCRAPGLDPVLNPPGQSIPASPVVVPAGCNRGSACQLGETFVTDESFGQRFCGCYGDFDATTSAYATLPAGGAESCPCFAGTDNVCNYGAADRVACGAPSGGCVSNQDWIDGYYAHSAACAAKEACPCLDTDNACNYPSSVDRGACGVPIGGCASDQDWTSGYNARSAACGVHFDALDFMRNVHGGRLCDTPQCDKNIVSYQAGDATHFYYVKGASMQYDGHRYVPNDGHLFERYGFDGNTIWLERDTSLPPGDGAGNDAYDAVDPLTHAYGTHVWAKRSMLDGDQWSTSVQIIDFKTPSADADRCQWSKVVRNNTTGFTHSIRLVKNKAWGGSIGTVDSIAITSGGEVHWYAKGWGWVRWEWNGPPTPGLQTTSWIWSGATSVPVKSPPLCPDGPLPFGQNP